MEKTKKIQLLLRRAERRDIPLLSQWLMSKHAHKHMLHSYPQTPVLLKNQLLKELAVSELIFSTRLVLVADLNHSALVGAAFVHGLDWKNKQAIVDFYIPPEASTTEIPPIFRKHVYAYLFKELSLRKVYQHCLSTQTERLDSFRDKKQEPEVIMKEYYRQDEQTADLYIFADYPNTVL